MATTVLLANAGIVQAESVEAQAIQVQNFEALSAEQEVIVVYKNEEGKEAVLQESNEVQHEFESIPAVSATLSGFDIQELKSNPNVVAIEPNITFKKASIGNNRKGKKSVRMRQASAGTASPPNDWNLTTVNAQGAWQDGFDGLGVKVAVIDSGISDHPDLTIAGGVNFVEGANGTLDPNAYEDEDGHGTHVAGTIGANHVGVAPGVDIYAVKVLDDQGNGTLNDIMAGIDWAIQNNMDIINLSLGTNSYSASFENIINEAHDAGILVVAAAGNDGEADSGNGETIDYPANYDNAIAVSAIDYNKARANFSSTGANVDVTAPGVDIWSLDYSDGTYAYLSGTSQASPHIAGLLAILKDKYPGKSNDQLEDELKSTVEDLGATGHDSIFGDGLPSYKASVADTTAPGEVSSLAVTGQTSTSIVLGFTNPTDPDFAKANIYVGGSKVGETTNGVFEVTGQTPDTDVTAVVKTVDTTGNESVGQSVTGHTSVATDTTAPAEVTNVAVTGTTTTSVTFSFDNPTDTDFAKVNVYVGGTKVGETTTGTYTVTGQTPDTDVTPVFKTVDATGNESVGVTFTGHTNPVPDTTAPAEVTNIAVTGTTTTSVTFSFDNPTDTDFVKVNVYVGGTKVSETTDGSYTVAGQTPDSDVTAVFKTVDASGNESTGVSFTGHTNPVPDTTAPGEVMNVAVTGTTTSSVTFGFDNPTDTDFAKVNVYVGGTKVGETTTGSYTVVGQTADSDVTAVFKTVDVLGNESVGVSYTGHTNPVPDTTAPAEVTNIAVTGVTTTSVRFIFDNPPDADFVKVNVYVGGSKVGETTDGTYTVGGQTADSDVTAVFKTVDASGNESVGVSFTGHTEAEVVTPPADTTAPAEVTNIAVTGVTTTTVRFIYENPSDVDFAKVNVYVVGIKVGESTDGVFEVTGLTPDTDVTAVFKTVDTSGNESTGVSYTGHTDVVVVPPVDTTAPSEVTNLAVTGKTITSVTFGFANPTDADFAKVNVYVGGIKVGESTNGSFTVTGQTADTDVTAVFKTVDALGNESVGVSFTGHTDAIVVIPPVDTTAPAEVTNVAVTGATTSSVTFGFTNPADADFTKVNVYVGGSKVGETTNGRYTVENQASDSDVVAVFKTVDALGNESVGVTFTGHTDAEVVNPPADTTAPAEVTNLSVTGRTTSSVTFGFTNPTDADFVKVNVYVGGSKVGESTNGSYRVTGQYPSTNVTAVFKTVDALGNESAGVSITGRTSAEPVVIPPTEPPVVVPPTEPPTDPTEPPTDPTEPPTDPKDESPKAVFVNSYDLDDSNDAVELVEKYFSSSKYSARRASALKKAIEEVKALPECVEKYKLVERLQEFGAMTDVKIPDLDELPVALDKKAFNKATSYVASADKYLSESTLKKAKTEVAKLPDCEQKQELLERLEEIEEKVNNSVSETALRQAESYVKTAEKSLSESSMKKAKDLLNKVTHNDKKKQELIDRLKVVEDKVQQIKSEKALKQAESYVNSADKYLKDTYVKKAKDILKEVPDNNDKKQELLERLAEVEEKVKNAVSETALRQAEGYVNSAEKSMSESYVKRAKDALKKVNHNDEKKDELLERLTAIEEKIALKIAESYVKSAERNLNQSTVNKAKDELKKVSDDNKKKQDLLNRIEKVEEKIVEKAYEYALSYVEKAEKYRTASYIKKAKVEVAKLPNGDKKDELLERLDAIQVNK